MPSRFSDDKPTVKLTVEEIMGKGASWPAVLALLEQVAPAWGIFALRLGLIEQLHRILDELGHHDARPTLVARAQMVLDALAHLPYSHE